MFTYEIIKSKRKTIAIQIYPDGKVKVRAPFHVTKIQIQSAVDKKSDWIRKRLLEIEETDPLPVKEEPIYKDGASVLFRGREYSIKVIWENSFEGIPEGREKLGIHLEENYLIVKVRGREAPCQPAVQEAILGWYRACARIRILERLEYFNVQVREPFHQVRIKEQKSRWGSCSSKRNLNFNWRLIKAPDSVLDYVVVHELCHLKEMNHSKRFWSHVKAVMPEYETSRKWLKLNGFLL